MDKKDSVVIGFILGIFGGAIFIAAVILPHSQEWLEKFSSYVNVLSTLFIGLLAAAIAYTGNKISKDNSSRDEYRFNWEKLTAWREMYVWMALDNNHVHEIFHNLLTGILRLSNYLALSEDSGQPVKDPKGSLIYFEPFDFSEVCKKIEISYGDIEKKILSLESNLQVLSETTRVYFKPDGNWNELLIMAIDIKGALMNLRADVNEIQKFRNGLEQAKKLADKTGNAYSIILNHIRDSKVNLDYGKVISLKSKMESISEKYAVFENKLNKFYRSYNPMRTAG